MPQGWQGVWRRWRYGLWGMVMRHLRPMIRGAGIPTEVEIARLLARPFGAAAGYVPVPDTPHVAFLRQFGETAALDPEAFVGSPYHEMACDCIRRRGAFFGIRDPDAVITRAEYFLALHRAIASGHQLAPFSRFERRSAMPTVAAVPGSDLLRIRNGHHRAAIYHVLGHATLVARVTRPIHP